MSANDKNSKQGQDAAFASNPKTAREAQQKKEERRANLMYGTIGVLFLLAAVAVIVSKSNVFQKNAIAATLYYSAETAAAGDEAGSSADSSVPPADQQALAEYSVPQVSYYFTNIYQNFVNNNSAYISYLGLDPNSSLRSQTYPSDETMTWFDYFMDQALTQMSSIYALNKAAADEGFAWNDDMQAELDANMAAMSTNAAAAGLSVGKYLQRIYGATMSQGVYEGEMKQVILASAFSTNYNDGLTYTTEQLEAEYNANRNDYDVVDYESVAINGSAESTTDADGNTVDPTEEESAAAMAAAESTANSIYAGFQSGGSLSSLADDAENATYTNGEAASYSSGTLMDWLFDTTRTAGDSAVLTDEGSSTYYVVTFGRRYRQSENTMDVRHILIQPESGTLAEDDAGYEEEQAQLKADAKAKAEEILAQWQSGGATEDAFAALANENSSDGGSNTNGGLYEQVYPGQMVDAFNDWCFDSSRQPGDTGIVETDYGYHIMYYVSANVPYWQARVESTLRNADFEAWYADITAGYTGEAADGAKYLG